MLLSFEGGDAKGSIIGRRAQRPRRNIDLDKVSQVLRGSASDNLIAETGYFVFDSLFYGEPMQLLSKRFIMLCSMRLKDKLGSRVLYWLEWFDDCLLIACQQGIAVIHRYDVPLINPFISCPPLQYDH